MFENAKKLFIITETPLHVGSGSELGVIDLPIQRERHTKFPKIEASSLKGSIRATFRRNGLDIAEIAALFGPEDGNLHGSAIGFTDARILLFPVKSMKGLFAWVTCPRVLQKFKEELGHCDIVVPNLPRGFSVTKRSPLLTKGKIVLEEFAITVNEDDTCTELANWMKQNIFQNHPQWWQNKIAESLVVLGDDEFRNFVTLSTEVTTRIKIDAGTGTVIKGALFTEEFLPTDTVMYSLILSAQIFHETIKFEKGHLEFFFSNLEEFIQIGGNATLGKGIVRLIH